MNAPLHENFGGFARIDPAKIKILLWDIDGTLIRSTVAVAYRQYFSATMIKLFGSDGRLSEITASGMTDSQIMYEALRFESFTPERILKQRNELLAVFKAEMTRVLSECEKPYEVLSGVRPILKQTHEDPQFINGLLTGNLSVAAEIKLSAVDLWQYFSEAPNAFGEISHERRELAVAAGRQFSEFYQFPFSPQQFIVIGDTPNDIACARHFGAKVISVATGRNHSASDLTGHKPDAVLNDLSDFGTVLDLFQTL